MAKVIIHFEDKKINSYQQDKQLYFVEGTIYKRTNLDFTEINNWLNNLNGFYSIVCLESFKQINDECYEAENIYAAVDRIRSKPLFYSHSDNLLYISDSVEWLRKKLKINAISQLNKFEFLMTGYVTGSETLFDRIKQLQTGEYLSLNGNNLSTKKYYLYEHFEPKEFDEKYLLKELDNICDKIIKKAIEYANNRQIVIPLSGGYDSRLIALKLKQLSYSNIVTFTYGLPNNKESNLSEKIAKSLGFKWFFVEYNSKILPKELIETGLLDKYEKYASNAVSLPHIQDFYAIKKLLDNRLIEENAVVIPGHTADFITGSHIPEELFLNINYKKVIDYIIENHYSLNQTLKLSNDLYNKLSNQLSKNDIITNIEIANEFEKWEWQERQAKFIANSVRVYDYFELDWWLPFWDVDFMEFWQKIPFILRKDHKWYINYVESVFKKITNTKYDIGNSNEYSNYYKTKSISKLKKLIKNYLNKHNPNLLKRIKNVNKIIRSIIKTTDTNDLTYLLFSNSKHQKFYYDNYKKNISTNGILALYYINLLEGITQNDK